MVDARTPIISLPKVGDVVKIRPEWHNAFEELPFATDALRVISVKDGGVQVEGDLYHRVLCCFEHPKGPW